MGGGGGTPNFIPQFVKKNKLGNSNILKIARPVVTDIAHVTAYAGRSFHLLWIDLQCKDFLF